MPKFIQQRGCDQTMHGKNTFTLFLKGFINNYKYANYANKIICISNQEIKGLCLSFLLVSILVVYDK